MEKIVFIIRILTVFMCILFLLAPLIGIPYILGVYEENITLGQGIPYAELLRNYISGFCILYLLLFVQSNYDTASIEFTRKYFPDWLFQRTLLTAYYISVGLSLFYTAFSLPFILPKGFELKMVLSIGAFVALFIYLLLICLFFVIKKIGQYTRNNIVIPIGGKLTMKALVILLIMLVICLGFFYTMRNGSQFIFEHFTLSSIYYVFNGLSLFALIFHRPIIKTLSR